MTEGQGLMTNQEAATYLGTTVDSLNSMRCSGRIVIPFVRLGSRIRFRKKDLDAWIEQNTVKHKQ